MSDVPAAHRAYLAGQPPPHPILQQIQALSQAYPGFPGQGVVPPNVAALAAAGGISNPLLMAAMAAAGGVLPGTSAAVADDVADDIAQEGLQETTRYIFARTGACFLLHLLLSYSKCPRSKC
jgi:hypothetical protein